MISAKASTTEFLLAIFQYLKTDRDSISMLTTELAAVRDALLELDPAFAEVLQRQRLKHQSLARPLNAASMSLYDDIIEALKNRLAAESSSEPGGLVN